MSPIPSSNAEKANWVNYRTGIKFIQFKMDAGSDEARIAIEINHKDPAIRELYFNHFKTFKKALEEILGEKWEWQPKMLNDTGAAVSQVFTSLAGVNIYKEEHWPQIITFLKKRIIDLDKFWNEYKEIFEMLT